MADLDTALPTIHEDHGKSTYQMDENAESQEALRRVGTTGNVSISPELFEKLYLGPKNEVSNNLRTTFGNPSPLYDQVFDLLEAKIADSKQCRGWLHPIVDTSFMCSPRMERLWRPWCSFKVSLTKASHVYVSWGLPPLPLPSASHHLTYPSYTAAHTISSAASSCSPAAY